VSTKPKWQGPNKDGLTQSLINKWLSLDPYLMYFYLILGKEEYRDMEDNLMWGDTAHVGLEHLLEIPETVDQMSDEQWEDLDEKYLRYMAENYPLSGPTFKHSIPRMLRLYDDSYKRKLGRIKTEVPFKVPYTTESGTNITLKGKIDGLELMEGDNPYCLLDDLPPGMTSGKYTIEHKFKGRVDDANQRAELYVDLQINIYNYVAGTTRVIYDIIRIPDTQYAKPPYGRDTSHRGYVKRLYTGTKWGDFPIEKNQHLWIYQYDIRLDRADIRNYLREFLDPVAEQITRWYDHVTQPEFDINNTSTWGSVVYRKPVRLFDPSLTQSYKGDFYGFRTGDVDESELLDVDSYYAELPEGKEKDG